MKATKTSFLFAFSILLTSCFDAPKFGDTPRIEYKDIYYGDSPTPGRLDSLVVELDFEDGDGDLGLSDAQRNFPYHEYDFFLTDGTSITHTVRNVYGTDASQTAFLDVPDGVTGLLVREGDLADLPTDPCSYKQFDLLVEEADKGVFNDTYTFVPQQNHYLVSGKFLAQPNRNNKNIFVTFYRNLTPENPNTWEVYNWPFCQSFDGRFTILSDEASPLSGTLWYTMSSTGFATIMGNDAVAWRLEFSIMDQLLRESNTVSTQSFRLKDIQR